MTKVDVGGVVATRRRGRRRLPGWLVWLGVTPFAIWAVFRLTGIEWGKFGVLLATGTPYVAIAAVVAFLIAALARKWIPALVALVSVVLLGFMVLPRAFASSETPAAGAALKILSINMRFGNADAKTIMDLVRRLRPDILNTQELSPAGTAALKAQGLEQAMPYAHLEEGWSASGSGIFSRLPLTKLPDFAPHNGHNMPYVRFTVPGGATVELVDVHTVAPLGPDVPLWQAAMRALPSPDRGTIRILAGDYNATLDHAEFRDVLARGYKDVGDVAGIGLTPTWPAGRRLPPMITIDHVVVDPRVSVVGASIHDVPQTDHRAFFADLRVPAVS
jgi:endonuclease/exonuclease/phosphatase (EEP) superfamily protein YafD